MVNIINMNQARYNLTTYYPLSRLNFKKMCQQSLDDYFLRNSIFPSNVAKKVQQFIYPLVAEENWNIKQILWRVFMPFVDQSNTLQKSLNCIGHIVYRNNTRQRLVSLFKLPSKLFIIFVFVWNSLWHVVMIKEGVDRMKEYSSEMLWHSITNFKLMIISFEFLKN